MGYKRIAMISISWVGLFRAFLRLSAFIRTAILARILSPSEFGVFGIAVIVLGLLEMFTETGVNVILIQEDNKQIKSYLNTAFTVSLIRGILISLIMVALTPSIGSFFNQPSAIPLLLLMSLVPLLRGLINPAIVQFQKNLHFKQEFLFKSTILAGDAAVAITTALLFRDAASLVYGLIAGVIIEILISHLFIKPRPSFQFDKPKFLTVLQRGKWITGAGVFSYIAFKTPDISLGKILSTTSLGYYQMAYRFALIPFEELIEIINRVAFPMYATISNDLNHLKKMFLKNTMVTSVIALLITLTVLSGSDVLVPLALGSQWREIIPYMKLMAIAGLLLTLSGAVNPLFLATKNQHYLTLSTFIQMVIMLILIYPATLQFEVTGTILVYILALLITLPIRWYFAMKSLSL